jgi:hypothetical protein
VNFVAGIRFDGNGFDGRSQFPRLGLNLEVKRVEVEVHD